AVGQHHRVVVDVDHARVGVHTLHDLMGVLSRRQSGTTVDELGDVGLLGQEPGHPDEEVPSGPREFDDLREDLFELGENGTVDFVVVLAAEAGVIHPGDTGPSGVDTYGRAGTSRRSGRHLLPPVHRWSGWLDSLIRIAPYPILAPRSRRRFEPSGSVNATGRSNRGR